MRTFTYLNLYGYLTDAVVVNRVFPEEVGRGLLRRLARSRSRSRWSSSRSAFAPVPILTAPYFEQEVIGAEMLDRLGERAVRASATPAEVLHEELTQELDDRQRAARAATPLPFAEKARHRAQEDRPRGHRARRASRSARSCCRRRWPPTGHAARASRRARSRSCSSGAMTEQRQQTEQDRVQPRWDEVDWDKWTPGCRRRAPAPGSGSRTWRRLFVLIDVVRSMLPRELGLSSTRWCARSC